jgi:chromosome segregation ATPase
LRFQLVDAGKEISELEIDVRRARAGLPLTTELSATSEEAEKNLAQLKRKVDRLRGTVHSSPLSLHRAKAHKLGFFIPASMLEMDAAMQKLTKEREELRDKNSDLSKLLDNAVQDKTKAENTARDVERRSARRIEELETKLKQKIDDNVDKERELEGLRGLPEQMEAQAEELKAVQRGADHARAELAEYRTKYDALTDKLQAELRQERSKSLDLETKIRSLTSQLEREKAKVVDEQKSRKEATDKLQKSKADSEKLHKKCDDLQLEVAHLEKTVRIYERNK